MTYAFRPGGGPGRTSLWAMLAVLAVPGTVAGQNSGECRDLVASQAYVVGSVCVRFTAMDVEILLTTVDEARILESRAAVAVFLDDFPLAESGVPRLGAFPHAELHQPPVREVSYRISRSSIDPTADELLVAVHASVLDARDVEHGAWADGTRFRPQGMPATYFSVVIPG